MRLLVLGCCLMLAVPACSLERRPVLPVGMDAGSDAPDDDAGDVLEDAGEDGGTDTPDDVPLDGGMDAPELPMDAPDDVPPDVPADVPRDVPPDVPIDAPRDAPACVPMEAACDRRDEDCDGRIDDDGLCSGCVAVTVAGRAYQSCPGPVTGLEAWQGWCRVAVPGYELAIFETAVEQDRVRAALAAVSTNPHLVGANDFDSNGDFVWFDRRSPPPVVAAPGLATSCVVFLADGTFEERACSAGGRVLCEELARPGPCAAEASGCNAVDDDCDGKVDEGSTCGLGCRSGTFWDHVYWSCADERAFGVAEAACTAMSAAPATLSSPTESTFLGGLVDADAWIGLTQAPASGSPRMGWRWRYDTSSYGVPVTTGVAPWAGSEPNDFPSSNEDGEEDCALYRDADGRFNDAACTTALDFACERAWAYPP